jgi:uncharacterized coiled-coil DUF342 family protein
MAENLATTGIDALAAYVKEHGETDLQTLAGVFHTDSRIVEHWAAILESAGIVRINNKLGKIFVSPMVLGKEEIRSFKSYTEVKGTTLMSQIGSKETILNQLEVNIASLGRFVADAEKAFKANAGGIKKSLDELDALQKRSNKSFEGIKRYKDYIDKINEKIAKDMGVAISKVGEIQTIGTEIEDSRKIISDLGEKMTLAREEIRGIRKSFYEDSRNREREFYAMLKRISDEVKMLEDILSEETRKLAEGNRLKENYRKDAVRMVKNVNAQRDKILDSVAKTKEDVDKMYAVAEKKNRELNGILDKHRETFGEIGQIDKKLKEISDAVENARKEREQIAAQFDEIGAALRAIESMGTEETMANAKKMEDAEESERNASKQLEKLEGGVQSINDDTEKLLKP